MPRSSIFAAGLLCGMAITGAKAAEGSAGGKFSFKPLSVEGMVLRDQVVIGPEFAQKHGIEVVAPFLFMIPRIKDTLRIARYPDELGQAYIKIIYGTADKRFMESIQFNPVALDIGPLEQRQRQLAGFLKNTVWPQITQGQGESTIDAVRGRKLGAFDAVELIGRYIDKKDANGTMLARVVVLIREDSRHGLIATINIATKLVQVSNDAQLNDTVSADILESVAFE